MTLYYQGYSYIKKSSSSNRQYWKCQHTKVSIQNISSAKILISEIILQPFHCRAGITHEIEGNKYKITGPVHTHEIITGRRRPGEYKALMEKINLKKI